MSTMQVVTTKPPRQPQRSLLLSTQPSSAATSRRLSVNLSKPAEAGVARVSHSPLQQLQKRPSSSGGLGYATSVQSAAVVGVATAKTIRRRSSGSSALIATRDAPSWVARANVTPAHTTAGTAALLGSKARPHSLLVARRSSGNWATETRGETTPTWRHVPSAVVAAAAANPRRASASGAISGWSANRNSHTAAAAVKPTAQRRESHTTATDGGGGSGSERPSSTSSASTSAPGTPTDERNASPVLGIRVVPKPLRAPLAPFTARTWARELEDGVTSPLGTTFALTPTGASSRFVRSPSPMERTPRRVGSVEGLRVAALRPLSSCETRAPMTLEGARAIARRASAGSIGGLACATSWRDYAAASGANANAGVGSKRNSTESIASIRETAPPGSASALFPDVPFRITPACVVRRRSQQRSVSGWESPVAWEGGESRRRSGAMSPLGNAFTHAGGGAYSRPVSSLSQNATPGTMSIAEARRKARQVAKRHSDGVEYADWPCVASPLATPAPAPLPVRSHSAMARPQTATQPGQLLGALANAPSPPVRVMSPVGTIPNGRRASKRRVRTATPPHAQDAATTPTTNLALPFRPASVAAVQQSGAVSVAAKEASEVEVLMLSEKPRAPSTPPKSRARQLAAAAASQAMPPRPISKDGREAGENASPFSLAPMDDGSHPYADASSFVASPERASPASAAAGTSATSAAPPSTSTLSQAPSPLATSRPSRVRRLSRAIRRALSFSRPTPPSLALAASLEPLPKRAKAEFIPTTTAGGAPSTPLRRASTRDARSPKRPASAGAGAGVGVGTSGSAALAHAWRADLARGPTHAPPSAWSPTRGASGGGVAYSSSGSTTQGGGIESSFSSTSSLSGYSSAPPQTPRDSPVQAIYPPSAARSGAAVGAGVGKGKRNSAGATMAFVRLRAKSLGASKQPKRESVHDPMPLPTLASASAAAAGAGKRSSVASSRWAAWSSHGASASVDGVGQGCLPSTPSAAARMEQVEQMAGTTTVRKAKSVKYTRSNSTLRTGAGAGIAHTASSGITVGGGVGGTARTTTPPHKRASLQSLQSYLRR